MIFIISRVLEQDSVVIAYVDRVIEEHPDAGVRAQFMYAAMGINKAELWRYYSLLQAYHKDTRQAEWARRKHDPDRLLQAGKSIPEFSFVSLENPEETFSDRDLRGRVYLIDFWGTWCGPCIEELPDISKTYERFKEQGFEVLSVAFMDDRETIQQFREEQYAMPWLHTLVEDEDDHAVRAAFELTGFPRPILVDEEGTIIAIDEALRHGKLQGEVARAFEAKPVAR